MRQTLLGILGKIGLVIAFVIATQPVSGFDGIGGDDGIGGGGGTQFPDLGDLQAKYNSYELDVLGEDLVGEHIDIDTGALSFTHIDISIPGNSALPVEFGRSRSRSRIDSLIPYISRNYLPSIGANSDRCTGSLYPSAITVPLDNNTYTDIQPESWFDGYVLNIPGQNPGAVAGMLNGSGSAEFSGTGARMVTKNNWLIKCFNSSVNGGEGYLAVAPNGNTYRFEHIKTGYLREMSVGPTNDYDINVEALYVTEIRDRHNNWVKYDYSGGLLSAIRANDGRRIDLGYNSANQISSATANGRTWTYSYTGAKQTVTLPDGRFWTLETSTPALDSATTSICAYHNSTTINPVIIKHPSGTTVTFDFTVIKNGRTNVDVVLADPGQSDPTIEACHIGWNGRNSATGFYSFAVTKKTMTLPSGETHVWTRDYEQDNGAYNDAPPQLQLPDTKKRTLTDANGNKTVFYLNRRNGNLEGTLKKQEIIPAGSTTPIQTVENHYTAGNIVGIAYKGRYFGGFSNQASTQRIYQTSTVTTQEGNTYTTDYSFQTNPAASDFAYNQPKSVSEFSNLPGAETRTADYTYTNYKTPWIIGLPKKVTRNGKTFEEHTYNSSTGKRLTTKTMGASFNAVTNVYNGDGTLKSITNAIGESATYSNYKRGLPQLITRDDNASQSLIVDNNGWVTRVTDYEGHCTNFSHNSIGRLTLIDPCDSRWSNTTISYATTTGSDGLNHVSAGMLKQTVNRGNYQKITYLDGLQRPRLVKEWDKSNSSTARYTRADFDAASSRTTYQSLPSTSSTTIYGTTTSYDALGRTLVVDDNTTSGNVSYTYLTNNKVRVNDNKGNQTTTTYQAFGSPSQSQPTYIAAPHSTNTTLDYDIYGNITSITQGGITEHRVYDSNLRLCKTVRPDVGNTAFNYNTIDQMVWQASGSSVSSSTTSCDTSVTTADKATYAYDNVGNVKSVTFSDASPDQTYTYDKNNQLTKLVAGAITTNYTYNSARLLEKETLLVDSNTFVLDYVFNSNGHLSNLIYPSGANIAYAPNVLGQPTKVGSYATSATYHANGGIKSFSYGNGFAHTATQKSSGLPNSVYDKKGSTYALNHSFTYDANSNLTFWDDKYNNAHDFRATYDGLDRLSVITDSYSGTGYFNYDSMGNITNYKIGNKTLTYTYNSNKRLTKVNGFQAKDFTYDSKGNVTNNGENAFVYNTANQMVSSSDGTYVYDGNNKRVKKVDGQGTSYSMYSNAGQLVYRKVNGVHTDYYYLDKKLVAKKKGSTKTYVHTDFLGSPAAESNTLGSVTSRLHYQPFGDTIEAAREDVGYTGHKFDKDLGLSYMQARYYDPVVGRFMSNDPVGYTAKNPMMSFNRYLYVNNNPYKYTDPNGEFLVGAIVGAVLDVAVQTVLISTGQQDSFDVVSVLGAAAAGAVGAGIVSGAAKLTKAAGGVTKALASVGADASASIAGSVIQGKGGEITAKGVLADVVGGKALGTVASAVPNSKVFANAAAKAKGQPNSRATTRRAIKDGQKADAIVDKVKDATAGAIGSNAGNKVCKEIGEC
jgi:RHS repeat-associated protein